MDYQLTENQTWAQILFFIVYQPIVANKTGKLPIKQGDRRSFPVNERANQARYRSIIEMSICVMDGRDICITDK